MRYKVDVKENFEQSLLFWLDRFIKSKLTSLSNRHVEENAKLSAIIGSLNHGSESMYDLKNLSKRTLGTLG